ncbi:hypothetical protein R3W88_005143 [Solanum pinnatisectum]|uniref:Ankyrin repeat-containing protein n=1 Tax=Solanum pinnatisectum TaxID=50273 RepID=A0AAV9KDW7_9SOLN|nr:hypothetical protein R3W88_005143 [Solanum pinnatisectum]
MLLAFTATFFLVYSNHTGWEPKLIAACVGIPVALFGNFSFTKSVLNGVRSRSSTAQVIWTCTIHSYAENQLPDPALVLNKWSVAEVILKKDPSLVRQKISDFGETVLQIVTLAGSTGFLMEPDDFELKTNNGNTAFSFAAIYGHKAMVSYLFEVTNLDMLNQTDRLLLLEITTHNEMYDVALKIFNKDRKLTTQMLQLGNLDVLHILSRKSLVISNQQGKLKRFVEGPNYNSPLPWTKFTSMARSRFITCKI